MLDLKRQYYLNSSSFLVYDKYSRQICLLGNKLGEFKVLNEVEAVIFQELKKNNYLEDFLRLPNIVKILEKFPEVFVLKKVNYFKNQGIFSYDPFTADRKQYRLSYRYLDNQTNEYYNLNFKSYNNQISEKWCKLLAFQNGRNQKVMNGGITFSRKLYELDDLHEKLISLNEKISDFIKMNSKLTSLINLIDKVEINNKCLNDLHLIFEQIYNMPETEEIKGLLREFNMLIHLCEECISENEGAIVEFVYEEGVGPLKLEALECSQFTTDQEFGTISLNYLQVGHSLMSAYYCDSDSYPRAQEYYNANHFLCFRKSSKFEEMEELKSWAESKFQIFNIGDEWNMGHIPVAKLENVGLDTDNIHEIFKKFSVLNQIDISEIEMKD